MFGLQFNNLLKTSKRVNIMYSLPEAYPWFLRGLPVFFSKKYMKTRMHSSRMRTVRLLIVSCSIPCISGGGFCPTPHDAEPLPRMQTPRWMQTPLVMWPVMHAGKPTPLWIEGMIHACENITFPQLLLRAVMRPIWARDGTWITWQYHSWTED